MLEFAWNGGSQVDTDSEGSFWAKSAHFCLEGPNFASYGLQGIRVGALSRHKFPLLMIIEHHFDCQASLAERVNLQTVK